MYTAHTHKPDTNLRERWFTFEHVLSDKCFLVWIRLFVAMLSFLFQKGDPNPMYLLV